VALPALRLSGIYLALGTAAFAVALDRWLFTMPAFHIGTVSFQLFGSGTLNVVPPGLFGGYANSARAQFVLVLVAFVLATLVVAWIRRSHFGRTLLASRDSEMACATFGMGLVKARLAVFALSSAIAGLGGALAGMLQGSVSAQDFTFTAGLPIFMLVVVGGAGFISAGLFTGVSLYAFFPVVSAFASWFTKIQNVTVGAAGVGLGREPSGAAPQFAEGLVAIRKDLRVQYTMYGVMVVAWLARLAGVLGNWSFVIALVVIGVVALATADMRHRRSAPARSREQEHDEEVPLEWLGLTEPWTPDVVAQLDRELALPSVGLAQGAGR
jgi:branched-chain amino acid transport system permease protein